MKKIIAIIGVGLVLNLTGCGFALRGTTSPTPQTVSLNVNDPTLKTHLKKELALNGIKLADTTNQINITDSHIARYDLVGVLSEVRLVLTANVQYELNGKSHRHTLTATRSHQYNEAGVSSQDKEQAQVREWLYADIARQISEQVHTLSQ